MCITLTKWVVTLVYDSYMETWTLYIYVVLPTGMHTPCMHQLWVISLIHQYINTPIVASMAITMCLSIYLFIYLSINLSIYLSIYIYLSIDLSILYYKHIICFYGLYTKHTKAPNLTGPALSRRTAQARHHTGRDGHVLTYDIGTRQ